MSDAPKYNAFLWNELATSRPDVSKAFYADVFGWEYQDVDIGDFGTYTVCLLDGAGVAGMLHMDDADGAAPIAFWTAYVAVRDTDDTARRVLQAGGTVKLPPTDVPELGRVTIVSDPTGAVIAFVRPEMPHEDDPEIEETPLVQTISEGRR